MSGYKAWPAAQKINWDNVDASRNPPPLPKWLYFGEITKAEATLSKSSGAPMVSCTIELGGSYDDAVDVGKRKMFAHLVFSERGAFRPKQLCEALGAEPPSSTSEEDLNEFAGQILGETVWMGLKIRKDDASQNDIDFFCSEEEAAEIAEKLEAPVETTGKKAPKSASKSRSANGASANGARGRAAPAEMDTEDEEEDDADEDEDDDEEVEAKPAARRPGRPPKDRSARR